MFARRVTLFCTGSLRMASTAVSRNAAVEYLPYSIPVLNDPINNAKKLIFQQSLASTFIHYPTVPKANDLIWPGIVGDHNGANENAMQLDSVMRKRKKKMKKHKLRKRRKSEKAEKRKLSQGR